MSQPLTEFTVKAPSGYVLVSKRPKYYQKFMSMKHVDALMSAEDSGVYTNVPDDGVFYELRKIVERPEIPPGTMGASDDGKVFSTGVDIYSTAAILSNKSHFLRPWLIMACKWRCHELCLQYRKKQWEKFERGEEWK